LERIQYKKTYLMNVILFVTFLSTVLFLGKEPYSKYWMFCVFCGFSSVSIITFYHNDVNLLWKMSLVTNLILLLSVFITLSLIVYSDPSNHFFIRLNREKYIWLSLFLSVVSLVNLKSLFQLKNTNEYLKNTPYKCLFIILILSLILQIEPYIPSISRDIREFYTVFILLVIVRKYLTRNK
jgi:hypothetical protein